MTTPGPVRPSVEGADDAPRSATPGEPGGADEVGDAPVTRREMKAQGIALTSEAPAIAQPLPWLGAAAAAHARRALAARHDAGHAVTRTGDLAAVGPSSGAVWQEAATASPAASGSNGSTPTEPGSAANGSAGWTPHGDTDPVSADDGEATSSAPDDEAASSTPPEQGVESAPEEAASAGRRPVVLAPLTASGIRTVDETGTITGVRAAVGRAVQSATSPASWESAVSLPAVALGIADVAVAPRDAEPAPTPASGVEAREVPSDGSDVSSDVTPDGAQVPADALADAARGRGPEGSAVAGGDSPPGEAASPASVTEDFSEVPRPRTDTRTMTIRVVIGLVVLLALVALVLLFSNGILGSIFAGDGGAAVGAAAVLAGPLARPRPRRTPRTIRSNARGAS